MNATEQLVSRYCSFIKPVIAPGESLI